MKLATSPKLHSAELSKGSSAARRASGGPSHLEPEAARCAKIDLRPRFNNVKSEALIGSSGRHVFFSRCQNKSVKALCFQIMNERASDGTRQPSPAMVRAGKKVAEICRPELQVRHNDASARTQFVLFEQAVEMLSEHP